MISFINLFVDGKNRCIKLIFVDMLEGEQRQDAFVEPPGGHVHLVRVSVLMDEFGIGEQLQEMLYLCGVHQAFNDELFPLVFIADFFQEIQISLFPFFDDLFVDVLEEDISFEISVDGPGEVPGVVKRVGAEVCDSVFLFVGECCSHFKVVHWSFFWEAVSYDFL